MFSMAACLKSCHDNETGTTFSVIADLNLVSGRSISRMRLCQFSLCWFRTSFRITGTKNDITRSCDKFALNLERLTNSTFRSVYRSRLWSACR